MVNTYDSIRIQVAIAYEVYDFSLRKGSPYIKGFVRVGQYDDSIDFLRRLGGAVVMLWRYQIPACIPGVGAQPVPKGPRGPCQEGQDAPGMLLRGLGGFRSGHVEGAYPVALLETTFLYNLHIFGTCGKPYILVEGMGRLYD
jgi:hypothetical protein